MAGFCEGYINNCDCRNCKREEQIREDCRKAAADALVHKAFPSTHIFAFTKLPVGCIYNCAHCSETSYAYFVLDKPSETVYLCATHFGAELYRTMRAYKINTIDGYQSSPPA